MPSRNRGLHEDSAAFRSKSTETSLREVQSSAAKTHLPQLLDEVERGATIAITRHGRRIARLVPEREHRWDDVNQAIDELEGFGRSGSPITVAEILSLRDQGRKY